MKRSQAFCLLIGTTVTMSASSFALAQPTTTTESAAPAANIIRPGDNLVVDGVPPVSQALAESIDRYTNARSAVLTGWHPVQRELLINTRFADTNQVHLVNHPLATRTQLTFFPDRVAGGSFHPTDGEYCIFAKDKGGDEFFQNYRYDFDDKNVTLLTDGKSRNMGGVWSNGGDRIAYGSTRRNGNDVDIFVENPNDPKTDHCVMQNEGGGWDVQDWSPNDKKLLVANEISINESYLWLLDLASGQKTLLTPKSAAEPVAYSDAQFAKDGKGIYLTTDKDSEFKRLAYMDLATHQLTFLPLRLNWDVSQMTLSHNGKLLALVSNEDGRAVLHLWDVAANKEIPLPKLPAGQVGGLHWHRNNRDLGFTLVSAQIPGDVYSVDVESGKVDRWTFSETGPVNTSTFKEPELVHWKSFDGKTISGFLYMPPAKFTGKRPVVVNIHGGPESQFRPTFLGRNNYFLDEMGVAILYPNIRGSNGYGKNFLKADNGFLRESSYKDIGALLDYIKTRPDLDADRVMITGGSYGGHMTLAISYLYSDRIRCSVDVVGMSNLVTFLQNTQGYRRDLRRVEYGDERDPKMHEFLEHIAPLNNVDKIRKPLFIIQGKNDPRVPASEALQMVAALKKQGTPVWFLMANDEGHGFQKKKNSDYQFYSTVEFMQQFLLQ